MRDKGQIIFVQVFPNIGSLWFSRVTMNALHRQNSINANIYNFGSCDIYNGIGHPKFRYILRTWKIASTSEDGRE